MVIFKWKTIPKAKLPSAVAMTTNEKGWMDEEMMSFWMLVLPVGDMDDGL